MLREKEKVHKQERKEDSKFKIILLLFFIVICSFNYCRALNLETLDAIEEKVFHEKFISQPKEARLSKLEMFLFGTSFPDNPPEQRLNKITSAIEPQKKEEIKEQPKVEVIKPEVFLEEKKDGQKVIYDESFNTGIIGSVSQLEKSLFNRVYNELPFQSRIIQLEENLLPKGEILKNRKKPLLERVSILIQRGGLRNQKSQNYRGPRNFTIDPNTGALLNEKGEIVRDNSGNPVTVRIPQPLGQQTFQGQNNYPLAPYGNQPLQQGGFPGQLPFDLFNQQDYGYGADPGF